MSETPNPTVPNPNPTKREEVLNGAREAVMHSRNKPYGHPADNFRSTAMLLTSALERKLLPLEQITASDVAQIMRLLKEARLFNTPGHRDSLVDIAGYSACDAECHGPEAQHEVRARIPFQSADQTVFAMVYARPGVQFTKAMMDAALEKIRAYLYAKIPSDAIDSRRPIFEEKARHKCVTLDRPEPFQQLHMQDPDFENCPRSTPPEPPRRPLAEMPDLHRQKPVEKPHPDALALDEFVEKINVHTIVKIQWPGDLAHWGPETLVCAPDLGFLTRVKSPLKRSGDIVKTGLYLKENLCHGAEIALALSDNSGSWYVAIMHQGALFFRPKPSA